MWAGTGFTSTVQGRGSPTVVLIHGFGGFSFDWTLVQQSLSATTRVCSYDRAGQAWSDRGLAPRGLNRITGELHALLAKSGERGPYVLVGQSWGGLIPRLYVPRYPQTVAGAVFVDSSQEDMWMWLNGVTLRPRLAPDSLWNRLWPRTRPTAAPAAPSTLTDTSAQALDTTTPKLAPPSTGFPSRLSVFEDGLSHYPPLVSSAAIGTMYGRTFVSSTAPREQSRTLLAPFPSSC